MITFAEVQGPGMVEDPMKVRGEAVRISGTTDDVHGIVVHDRPAETVRPRAVAFVWGAEPRASRTLPFGRWKGGAPGG
jgi:hypothetical protein